MDDEEQATLESQFDLFSKFMDTKSDGTTMSIRKSDYWMRQARMLDDRKLTMTETGLLFNKFSKSELSCDEWLEFVQELCERKGWNAEEIQEMLTNCGFPGTQQIEIPEYKNFFKTYKPKEKLPF